MSQRWSRRARRDLRDIARYIARDDPASAVTWIARVRHRVELAAAAPLGGRVVPEIGRSDVREVFLRAYRLVYRVVGKDIRVLTVFEGHQRFPADADPDA